MRLKTGKENQLSVQILYKMSHHFNNERQYTQSCKGQQCNEFLVFNSICMFTDPVYFKVCSLLYHIPIIKRVGKDKSLSSLKESSQVKITARASALQCIQYEIMHIKLVKTGHISITLNKSS